MSHSDGKTYRTFFSLRSAKTLSFSFRNVSLCRILLENVSTLGTRLSHRTYVLYPYKMESRDSSVSIALGYGLDNRVSRVRFLAGAGNFLFTTTSRTAQGPTQPPIQWVPEALSLGLKRPGCEADHSPPSTVEVKE
jgi:hypothetical protein